MIYICHRVNTVEELTEIDSIYGVELDVRDATDGSLYIYHDPYVRGQDFEEYLRNYHHDMMILNIKSERIEWKVIELLQKYNVSNYFFLDCSIPMIITLTDTGEHNVAIRISEFESIETARLLSGRAKWIWLDNFYKLPISVEDAEELHCLGYRICLVSPELQNRPKDITSFADIIDKMGIDAICTKSYNIKLWKNLLERK